MEIEEIARRNYELSMQGYEFDDTPEDLEVVSKRVKEINEGLIETADNTDVTKLQYNSAIDVFPLETEGVRVVKKVENKYSDYKCFTN